MSSGRGDGNEVVPVPVPVQGSSDSLEMLGLGFSEQSDSDAVALHRQQETEVANDLIRSGLTPQDMCVRVLSSPEKSAANLGPYTRGYVIPYFDIAGNSIPFYRIRVTSDNCKRRYVQPNGMPNHIYFPPNFKGSLNGHRYIVVTEGEKKAALATKLGIPTVGLGGVYSWRNNLITIPKGTALQPRKGNAQINSPVPITTAQKGLTADTTFRLSSDFDRSVFDPYISDLAVGLSDLVSLTTDTAHPLTIIIMFDSDSSAGSHLVKTDIQTAAARLGFELRYRGIPLTQIKQIKLPLDPSWGLSKVGMDDYLILDSSNIDHLVRQIEDVLSDRDSTHFPIHPNVCTLVKSKLQGAAYTTLKRKDLDFICLTMLADLDARGRRLKTRSGDYYYHNADTKELMHALGIRDGGGLVTSDEFRNVLYQRYNIAQTLDARAVGLLAQQFSSEQPLRIANPQKSLHPVGDGVAIPVNPRQYILCGPDNPLIVKSNGDDGILFTSNRIEATTDDGQTNLSLDTKQLVKAVEDHQKKYSEGCPIDPWWYDTLMSCKLRRNAPDYYEVKAATLLFYMSPWLHRWKGLQLPIELVVGEQGSGKTTLMRLRQIILEGGERLLGTPPSIKDWTATVANSSALHVIDNITGGDRNLIQGISDEMCRIVTSPNPTVALRRLYTEFAEAEINVNTVFALTSIKRVFYQQDLLMRAFNLSFDKGINSGTDKSEFSTDWLEMQLEKFGGRTAWFAHHLTVLHRFFKIARKEWSRGYMAKYRLDHFEQCMRIMARVFGWDDSWVPSFLSNAASTAAIQSDYAIQGLDAFADHAIERGISRFFVSDMVAWFQMSDDFCDNTLLNSTHRLSVYIETNKVGIAQITGIVHTCTRNRKPVYTVSSKHQVSRNQDTKDPNS